MSLRIEIRQRYNIHRHHHIKSNRERQTVYIRKRAINAIDNIVKKQSVNDQIATIENHERAFKMMGSSFDDDEFAPNPFRTSNSFDASGNEQPQQQSYGQNNTQMMQGNMRNQPQFQQFQQQPTMPNPGQYLSGQMDQGATQNSNYGATREIPSTPFSIFSWRGLVACMRLDAYQKYFDVDTVDVVDRLKASLFKFYEPDLFRTVVLGDTTIFPNNVDPNAPYDPTAPTMPSPTALPGKGPDLYGPLWISMTLIFILGMTSNLSAYFHHQRYERSADDSEVVEDFDYDITHLFRAGSIVMIFCFVVPTGFWFVTHCLGMPAVSWAMWMCCYGYSAVPIMAGALVAWWFPYSFWHWLTLAAATTASGMLVVRNLSTPLLAQDAGSQTKAAPLILAILGTHFIYMCVLKFSFFTYKN